MGDLWDDWSAHYKALGIDAAKITRDGAADTAAYQAARFRIVFVLKDSNDWPGHSLHEAMLPGPIRMFIMLSRWAFGMLNDFPPIGEADKRENQIRAIRQVAAINLKKFAGSAVNDWKELERFAVQDRALLRRQLAELTPDVLVACGTWDLLLKVLAYSGPVPKAVPRVVRDSTSGALVVSLRHPGRARRVPTYESLRATMQYANTLRI